MFLLKDGRSIHDALPDEIRLLPIPFSLQGWIVFFTIRQIHLTLKGFNVQRRGYRVASPSRIENTELNRLRELPISDVARALGVEIRLGRAMCFNGHDKSTPSFIVHKSKNTWKCYGCGEYGDTITLVEKVLSLDFKSSCEWLRRNFGVIQSESIASLPAEIRSRAKRITTPSRSKDITTETEADSVLYTWLLERCGSVVDPRGVSYLNQHGISLEVANSFRVVEVRNPKRAYDALEKTWGADRVRKAGLSNGRGLLLWSGYSVLFPFMNGGSVDYMQVRCLVGNRKFIGLMGIEKPIFNHARLQRLKPNQILHICEGVPDAMALEGRGLAAIGILGASSFRAEWIDELLPFDIVGVPDGDSGGESFRRSLTLAFRARSKSVRFVSPPAGMDACDVIARITDA